MDYLKDLEVKNIGEGRRPEGIENTGTIIAVNGSKITVRYLQRRGLKLGQYKYPDAFRNGTLSYSTRDEGLRNRIEYDKQNRESIAFKYNFCDGGCTDSCIGYNGVCSDTAIKKNINEFNREWCGGESSLCKKYLDGEFSREELEKKFIENEFICYESNLLRSWRANVGIDTTTGRPRHLRSNVDNGLAIITTTTSLGNEEDRFVFAVFLIRTTALGDRESEGSVMADGPDPQYKIILSKKEATQIKFWNYYSNPNSPDEILFSSGLYRYISHARAARLLKDIVDIVSDNEKKQYAQEFLDYFCRLHNITEIPEKDGALTRT